jgi:hypothetical protein
MLKSDIKILSVEDISQVVDRAEQVLDVPEWGGAIRLKAWSLTERDRVMALATDSGRVDGKLDAVKLVHLSVIYGVAEPKLTEETISGKAWPVIDRIAQAVMALNGLTQGVTLSASSTFRPAPGPAVPVPPGEGPGEGAGGTTANDHHLGDGPVG